MNQKQKTFLELLPIGEEVHVATSNYSLDPIESSGWNPITKTTAQVIKALTEKEYLKSFQYFRGATVTRLK